MTTTTTVSIIDLYAQQRHVQRDDLVAIVMSHIMPKDRSGAPVGTKADMIAFLQIAHRFDLDPWAGEIFIIPTQRGCKTYVSVDGYAKIASRTPDYDGCDFSFVENVEGKVVSCTCTIWRKGSERGTSVTEYLSECYRDTAPWKQAPRRMLRHKAFMQAVRLSFGISGALGGDDDHDLIDITPPMPRPADPEDAVSRETPAEDKPTQEPAGERKVEEATSEVPKPKRAPPRKPAAKPAEKPAEVKEEFAPMDVAPAGKVIEGEVVEPVDPQEDALGADDAKPDPRPAVDIDKFVDQLSDDLRKCETEADVDALWEERDVDATLTVDEDALSLAQKIRAKTLRRVQAA